MAVMVYLSQVGMVWTDMEAVDKDVVVWDPKHLRTMYRGEKPPISPLPEARGYARVVRFGETAAVFLTALDESVTARQESSIRACQEAVRKEMWLARVEQISELVRQASP